MMDGSADYAEVDMSGYTISEMAPVSRLCVTFGGPYNWPANSQVTEAELLCQQQAHQSALSLATQCVARIEAESGKDSIRLVDPYVVLGLAHAGLGALKRSEKILAVANFVLLKNPDAPAATKSKLFRALGVLYMTRKKHGEALRILADDVYNAAVAHGPESCQAAGGYFLMADVFDAQGAPATTSAALRDKVADIWTRTLSGIVPAARSGDDAPSPLLPVDIAAAQNQLIGLVTHYEAAGDAVKEGRAASLLAALYFSIDEVDLMVDYAHRAVDRLPESDPRRDESDYLLDIAH